jgi:nucleoid DNA-binding protein
MDTSLLASHCIELLRTHNRVSLGNMGSFMAEDTPATLTHNLHVLLPPGRRISFKESETWNDGLLEKVYGDPDALEALLSEVSKKLVREKSVTLDGFGKLRRTREGDVFL